jgi:DNA-binding response OmpR family regulator
MYEEQRSSSAQIPHREKQSTVLVVGNDAAFRTELCRILRNAGYASIPARSGIEAQWFADHHAVDLLITDVMLPEVDGYHLGITFLRLHHQMPVIFTSARGRSQCIASGLLDPGAPFLRQPYPPGECARLVRRVLREWLPPMVA